MHCKQIFIYIPVADLALVSLTEGQDTLCLSNILINTSLKICVSLPVVDLALVSLTEGQDTLCLLFNILINIP